MVVAATAVATVQEEADVVRFYQRMKREREKKLPENSTAANAISSLVYSRGSRRWRWTWRPSWR
jgi:hypothetical protein